MYPQHPQNQDPNYASQQPQLGGYGFGAPPPPPKKNHTALYIGLGCGVSAILLVAGAVVALYMIGSNAMEQAQLAQQSTTTGYAAQGATPGWSTYQHTLNCGEPYNLSYFSIDHPSHWIPTTCAQMAPPYGYVNFSYNVGDPAQLVAQATVSYSVGVVTPDLLRQPIDQIVGQINGTNIQEITRAPIMARGTALPRIDCRFTMTQPWGTFVPGDYMIRLVAIPNSNLTLPGTSLTYIRSMSTVDAQTDQELITFLESIRY